MFVEWELNASEWDLEIGDNGIGGSFSQLPFKDVITRLRKQSRLKVKKSKQGKETHLSSNCSSITSVVSSDPTLPEDRLESFS